MCISWRTDAPKSGKVNCDDHSRRVGPRAPFGNMPAWGDTHLVLTLCGLASRDSTRRPKAKRTTPASGKMRICGPADFQTCKMRMVLRIFLADVTGKMRMRNIITWKKHPRFGTDGKPSWLEWRFRVPIGNNGAMHFTGYPEAYNHAHSLRVYFWHNLGTVYSNTYSELCEHAHSHLV